MKNQLYTKIVNNISYSIKLVLNEEIEGRIKATEEWMVEHYTMFNEMYFNNTLPSVDKVGLYVKQELKKSSWLGCQGFSKHFYMSKSYIRNGKYLIFTKTKNMLGRHIDPDSVILTKEQLVNTLKPYICISARYMFNPEELEDTMIHEMIHLYTYMDCKAPKQAHGKEFKAMCNYVRALALKNGKHYHLTTYVTDNTTYELTDEEKEVEKIKVLQRLQTGGGICSIYIKALPSYKFKSDRFLFSTVSMLEKLLARIKVSENDKLVELRVNKQGVYELMVEKYGNFLTMRTYRWWNCEDYPEFLNIFNNCSSFNRLNEDKKPYIKPTMSIIEIPAGTNLSNINLEDLVNAIDSSDNEILHGDLKNDLKIVDPNE